MFNTLFHVETLDNRFASKSGEALSTARPSKWKTPEYYIYYAFFLTIPFLMFKSVYDVSQPSHPSYSHYAPLLSPGWIPGRKVDNSDAQYRGFRDNIPYMALLLILHPLLRRAYERLSYSKKGTKTALSPDARLNQRITFDVVFAIILLIALHGISIVKIFIILFINYKIPTALPRPSAAIATWTFNVAVLFANELCRGYRFADIALYMRAPQSTLVDAKLTEAANWGIWLDSYGGLLPRWEVLFNITILRLIAFNFDYLWSQDRRVSSPIEKKNLDSANLPERERVSMGANPEDFTFRNYLAYVLYSPLYLTGPIINFNDYIAQSRYTLRTISRSRIIPYALRFALCLLTMELVLHYLYAVAICSSKPDWRAFTPFQLSMLGYFNLHVIWLKLLLPWRFFRLWALCDSIDPPENMVRCMSDNYSALAFWRGWHRSFNRWIVRYIYVPMGGSHGGSKLRAALNYAAVFTFVALWHDINLRLLIWGWSVVLFVLPEVLARMAFPAKKWKDRPNQYRWLCGAGAIGNVLMMMAANLVGFAIGVDGLKGLMNVLVSTFGGRIFLIAACATLFVGVQVMFEWREAEKRRGVDMKC